MMNFSKDSELGSLRLKTLQGHYTNEKNIWDIGCDHGLLGASFLEVADIERVHLVDVSRDVVETLKSKFKDSYISKDRLFISRQKGQEIRIQSSSNLVFIAGMGGKEMGEIIDHLLPFLDETSNLVISPHRKILELRSHLRTLPLHLQKEDVIFEDGQYYQILKMTPHQNKQPIPPFGGPEMWQSLAGRNYRDLQIKSFSHHRDQLSQDYVSYLKHLNI
jgi:tRNA (adenine22-N1)-methyltransferase